MFIRVVDYQGNTHIINTNDIFHIETTGWCGTNEIKNLVLYGRGHNSAYKIDISYGVDTGIIEKKVSELINFFDSIMEDDNDK